MLQEYRFHCVEEVKHMKENTNILKNQSVFFKYIQETTRNRQKRHKAKIQNPNSNLIRLTVELMRKV
jgi:hypothetical protein